METNEERLDRIENSGEGLEDDDFDWLVERAEQAERLEMRYENTGARFGRMQLVADNERLREALELYADEETYEVTGEKFYIGHGDFTEESYRPIEKDAGCTARKALEETK